MKNKFALMIFGLFVLSLTAAKAPLYAHHGFEFEYDTKQYVIVTGTLTKVEWENPHIYFNVDEKIADGTTRAWRFEGSSVAIVQRTGTKRADLVDNIGKTIVVSAVPGRGKTATSKGAAEKVKLPNGKEIIVARQRFYGNGAPTAADDKN
jgi:Family of unknown function (DUF6152)